MDYSTNATYFLLTGHVELEKYRYVYFVLTITLYLLIIVFNTLVIFVIVTNKPLHEPMYIFVAALLLNALIGATGLYPKLLIDILSESPSVSRDACSFQFFVVYTCAMSEFTLLSAMAYDRYLSICKPLQYVMLVKTSTVKKILFFCWFVPSCENGISMILTYRLQICGFKLNRIYCNNFAIVKLSCGDISANNIYGLFVLCVAVFPPVIFVIFTYIRILSVCLKNSKEFQRKALRTCFPHLVIFFSFSATSCFEVLNSRLEGDMPHIVAMILSVENMVIPPLLNPIIYGLKLKEIFNRIKKMIWKRNVHISF